MSRLKFAWARGARIQEYQNRHITGIGVPPWWGTDSMPDWNTISALRIHPDDEHLAYGPISRALIEQACRNEVERTPFLEAGVSLIEDEERMRFDNTPDHLCDFLAAFYAEYLADEGL